MKRETFLELTEIVLFLILVTIPIRFLLFEPFFVRGGSMEPTLHDWDYLIIDKLTYHFRNPTRGEIVVFHPPFDNRIYYIKRIVGLPGEKIILNKNKITIFNKENPNGFTLEENYSESSSDLETEKIEITLKTDEYFVLGDNREESYDSRKWGPIKKDRIIGRVFIKIPIFQLAKGLSK